MCIVIVMCQINDNYIMVSFRHVRFRFHQIDSDVVWGLDRIFVGPACPDACSGHGDCVGLTQNDLFRVGETNHIRNCLCDLGYAQPNCHVDTDRNKVRIIELLDEVRI